MIIQLDTYDQKVNEFARAYLDYYHNGWKSEPIHRLASLQFREKLNEGGFDSVELGIGVDYKLSQFNKKDYELSKCKRQRYDFPGFDGEAILIFLRYINKHNNHEKKAIISKLYGELGPKGEVFKSLPHKEKSRGGRKSRRRSCCIRRTHGTRHCTT
jgi:hypothetical protein